MKSKAAYVLLSGAVVALGAFALVVSRPVADEAFAGTDGKAVEVVEELRPGYEPWVSPVWEPPSGEIESLLFGLQSAVGAGLLCYALGYWRGSRRSGSGSDA